MKMMLAAAAVMAMALTVQAAGQDVSALAAARDLYASARYDEALAVLNDLRSKDRADRKWVEQYRSLCLLALGRGEEAEMAIGAVIAADPTYTPSELDTSPRVRSTFTEVRRRLLPEIATARYVTAKERYDRRDWEAAGTEFEVVLSLLRDPDMAGRLGDLRLLAEGFLELSARAAEAGNAAVADPQLPPEPPPPAAPADLPDADRVYLLDDEGVSPPVVIRQQIPSVPKALIALSRPRGLLDLVIDEQGRVVSMAMRLSIHPTYDSLLLSAARDWKYEPATVNGHPVRFRKLIQVAVTR